MVEQTFNSAGRVTQVTSSLNDAQHPGTLAWDAQYSAAGAMEWMYYGNGLLEARAFNNRMQPCRINVNSSWTAVPCQGSSPSGNVLDLSYGYNHGAANNGSVMTWAAAGQQNWSRSYEYDELNRLKRLTGTGTSCTALEWTYDIWGNRTNQSIAPGGAPCTEHHPTILSNNRISGLGYDAAGNVTLDSGTSYQWDAENRMISSAGTLGSATYVYDAFGRRVQKTVGAAQTHYLYDLAGNVVTEINQSGGWQAGYIYLNGQLLAEYKDSTTYFAHLDHLGSTRALTRVDQSLRECDDYLPFGELLPCGDTGATTHKFTGLERDSESNLDHTWFRKYSATQGRFCSADPVGGNIADPQSLNRYTYVRNDPVNLFDPLGLEPNCWTLWDVWVEWVNVHNEWMQGQIIAIPIGTFCDDGSDGGGGSGGDGGGNGQGGGPEPRATVNQRLSKEFVKAFQLAQKLKCAEFLRDVAQKGLLLAAERTDRSQLSPGEQAAYDSLANPFQYALRSGFAGVIQHPNVDPISGGLRTIATANYMDQSITFYRGFYDQGRKTRAQTLLHEGLHLTYGLTDQQLARAVGHPSDDPNVASWNFQRELVKKCK